MKTRTLSRRFKLVIEYDGTNFSGWQKQNDARTIQGDLLKAAARVFGDTAIDIQGCGRTDAGVHGLRYVAHLDVATELAPAAIRELYDEELPKDIAVIEVASASSRFHARHHCHARCYLYQVGRRKSAFGKRYVWWVRDDLDLAAMREAASLMVGMHDFASFAEKQELKKSTKVLVHAVELREEEGLLLFRVVGSHFLWRMVRRMVGVLVEVGRHGLSVEEVGAMLAGQSEVPVRHTAPSGGLFFERAFYDEEEVRAFLAELGVSDTQGAPA
ncbi:MAG: tRNA pseudouridine(38-40) synthase TruA [Desulfobulbaceae bacterium]|nr:tRNA pseudouridine(38-40) synthase TruA [Desulfobulbaceae bacterium]